MLIFRHVTQLIGKKTCPTNGKFRCVAVVVPMHPIIYAGRFNPIEQLYSKSLVQHIALVLLRIFSFNTPLFSAKSK
jgi:hypothetical protein